MARGKASGKREIDTAERRLKVLAMRRDGMSYRPIAKVLGCSVSTVHSDLNAALTELAEQTSDSAAKLRHLQQERITMMYRALMPAIRTGNVEAIREGRALLELESRLFGALVPETIMQTNVTVELGFSDAMPLPAGFDGDLPDVVTLDGSAWSRSPAAEPEQDRNLSPVDAELARLNAQYSGEAIGRSATNGGRR